MIDKEASAFLLIKTNSFIKTEFNTKLCPDSRDSQAQFRVAHAAPRAWQGEIDDGEEEYASFHLRLYKLYMYFTSYLQLLYH